MSNGPFSKGKLLITASCLALVAVGALYVGGQFPMTANQTSGTIVPAERYRAAQVSSNDVQLGD